MSEVWKEFANGFYEVSSLGNVRRAKPGIATFVGRPISPIKSGTGYAVISVNDGSGKQKVRYLHHVVAEAFIGQRPDGFVVNHRDGNKQNNEAANLEYVSRKENAVHAVRTISRYVGPKKPPREKKGLQKGDAHWTRRDPSRIARGDRMPHTKMNAEIVRSLRARVAAGEKQIRIAEELQIGVAQISRIVMHKRWSYVQ